MLHFSTVFKVKSTYFETSTVEPVLETTCIKQSTALKDHTYDTTTLLKST